jgi:hypothetical protein
MVPLARGLGGFRGGETSRPIGSDRRKRLQLGFAYGKHIAVTGEPISFLFGAFLVFGFEFEIEHLDFDTFFWEAWAFQFIQRSFAGPYEDPRIASRFLMHPFDREFKVGEGFVGADNTDGFSCASDFRLRVIKGPGIRSAVYSDEIRLL